MNCKKAEQYMMKYLDETLTEEEAQTLHSHMKDCPLCSHSFLIYDEIQEGLSQIQLVQAPDAFEHMVLLRLENQAEVSTYLAKEKNPLVGLWGTFTGLLGVGTVLVFTREQILQLLLQNPHWQVKLEKLLLFQNEIQNQTYAFHMMGRDILYLSGERIGDILGFVLLGCTIGVGTWQQVQKQKKMR